MTKDLVSLTVTLLCLTGVSVTEVQVTQWPVSICCQTNTSVDMHCIQKAGFEYMYWYRHLPGEGPKLMATFFVGSAIYEPEFSSGIRVWSPENSGQRQSSEKRWSLTVERPQVPDQAVYLCAISPHSESGLIMCVQFHQSPSQINKDGGQCGAAGLVVLQPRHLFTLPGNTSTSDPVVLRCSMGSGISMSSYTMLWYRQVRYGGPIEFLIKEYDAPTGRYQATFDTSKNSFFLQVMGQHDPTNLCLVLILGLDTLYGLCGTC
ncbi:hypothetical protein DPEC_G00312810 [Dallia pectoralis]|uniref:Uncharacterized protein n=1 Tax=Dallia pectoralis TaxID=75939 RepID=A0ACC2FC04_DALPE|nr:hypothetical protein DPEC_G00312810 [Dallia pectoralis]